MDSLPIIIITWHDAGAGHTPEEAKSHIRQSVGFEVENTPGSGVLIAMEEDQLSGVHWIPWPYIKKIERLDREKDAKSQISEA